MTNATTAATLSPAELNGYFATGSYGRATSSALVMSALFPKRAKNGVYGAMANKSDKATLVDLGYSQSPQTLAIWATVATGLELLADSLPTDPATRDALANTLHSYIASAGKLDARIELVESFATMTNDEITQLLTNYVAPRTGARASKKSTSATVGDVVESSKGKRSQSGPVAVTGPATYGAKLAAKLDALAEYIDPSALEDISSKELDDIIAKFAAISQAVLSVRNM